MIEFMIHFLTVLVTALVVESRRWIADAFSQAVKSTPKVDEFEKEIERGGYKKEPDKRYHCYIRKNYKPKDDELPTYHFFIRDDIDVQAFMAFLLPSLDLGHGRRSLQAEHGLEYRFGKNWDKYLHDIANKLRDSSDSEPSRKTLALLSLKGRRKLPIGSRIVFFDKTILLPFLFHHDWIYQARDGSDSRKDKFAKSVVEYIADIVVIHNRMQLYEGAITCRYVAESVVVASDYYDFGLYMIEGAQIVYTPIYKKDNDQKIQTEKILIGDIARQKRRISEFVEDYKRLWQKAEDECGVERNASNAVRSAVTSENLNDPAGDLYRFDYLTPEFFDRIYVQRAYSILREKSDFVIPPIADLIRNS